MTTKQEAVAKLASKESALAARHLADIEKLLASYAGDPYRIEGVPEPTVDFIGAELIAAGWKVTRTQTEGQYSDQRDQYKAPALEIS